MEILNAIWPLLLMFAIFYFLLIRPQQKRQKAVQQMQSDLKKGDRVVTIGGMHGTVEALDESQVIIKSPDGSKLTFDRAAIREVKESL
ncbi:preprotein translocase subunit YajC [Bacillus sp. CGMCC 1.16541]|uniref:preprotein translocase subunit YajC n=1 Tax=Bacillus sp. CGMCC 1.16541 TaxID=2185143 RepID=UPI000D73E717|nr:preprotein translocase subunit YajC [Bacillus sp. CGMCC 1.16541]